MNTLVSNESTGLFGRSAMRKMIARATWTEVLAENWSQHAGQGMANDVTTLNNGAANPKSLGALAIATTYVKPFICFLTSCENTPTAVPKIQLITSGAFLLRLQS
jgi:hypothetical protein